MLEHKAVDQILGFKTSLDLKMQINLIQKLVSDPSLFM